MQYDFRDEKQAQEYLKTLDIEYRFQCYKEKKPEGCQRLADFLDSIRKDFMTAATVYKANCEDSNYGLSCYKYANYNIMGKGMEKNENEAMKYYSKACELDHMPACHSVGLIHSSKKICPPDDMGAALQMFMKACDKGFVPSCYYISGMYIKGSDKVPKDMKKASEFSKKACEMGHLYACSNLSQMYRKGDGVEKSTSLADKFEKMAKEIRDSQTRKERTIKFGE
ncbi:cytochrome c oxidase assembly factor 7 homolog [Haliotis asinina]|uniref:cytochrome c oxidase assembly factor 7 homolog n=1 Tax=Haliotis asinina TaxID=109174 RepID=UPI0035321991